MLQILTNKTKIQCTTNYAGQCCRILNEVQNFAPKDISRPNFLIIKEAVVT